MFDKILVGCDPELFVKKDNMLVSAHGLIEGTKQQPFPVNAGGVQVDGLALEFNINPATNEKEWLGNIATVMEELKALVPTFTIIMEPVAHFTDEVMRQQPAEALELGCDPDFNAWHYGDSNPSPCATTNMRTAAGHIHIGWTEGENINSPEHNMLCQAIVRQLDFYLGLPSLLFDDNIERRQMYGKAGAFRPKSYGVEYRVLSNVWLTEKGLQSYVYKQTLEALQQMEQGNYLPNKVGNIEDIINTSNVEQALNIITHEGIKCYE